MNPMLDQLRSAPLRWRPWGAAAATEAHDRQLPMAVLIGDALDAWTSAWINAIHDDREVCDLLDAAFLPIAAERCDHPGLAALAQQVLGMVADAAGVPCMLILLPGQPPVPFGAVPYGPVRDGQQRKGLGRILLEVAEGWRIAADDLRSEADHLAGTLAGMPFALAGNGKLQADRVLGLAEAQIMGEAHALEGGFGATPDGSVALPRWPQPEKLRLLAALASRPDAAPSLRAHLERTLAALAAGGIRDQLGGGFHRASADAGWNEPLWEQRLADQARLARAFLDGFALTGQPLHREIAERALTWAVLDLAQGDAHWAAGRHAVSRLGRSASPGAYQGWNRAQCAEVVGTEGADILARRFALDDEPGPLAVRGQVNPAESKRLPELVSRLTAARAERAAPPLDPREDLAAQAQLLGALHAAGGLADPSPDLIAARDALHRRLASLAPQGRSGTAAQVALALAECGDPAATAWLQHAQGLAQDGLFPNDDDILVAPMPRDAEDTVDGAGAAGAVAMALAALGRRDDVLELCRAHAGLLGKAPAVAPSLVLALLRASG
jgi:uncharacterized protein